MQECEEWRFNSIQLNLSNGQIKSLASSTGLYAPKGRMESAAGLVDLNYGKSSYLCLESKQSYSAVQPTTKSLH
jgi:hypothetical protein